MAVVRQSTSKQQAVTGKSAADEETKLLHLRTETSEAQRVLSSDIHRLLGSLDSIWGRSGGFLGYFTGFMVETSKNTEDGRSLTLKIHEDDGVKERNLMSSFVHHEAAEKMNLDKFYQYCEDLNDASLRARNSSYRDAFKWLDSAEEISNKLECMTNANEKGIHDLTKLKVEVRKCTDHLKGVSDKLMSSRRISESAVNAIESRRLHYQRLDGLKYLLDSSSIYTRPEELEKALDEVDASISFFEIHKDYIFANKYLQEYKALRLFACRKISSDLGQILDFSQLCKDHKVLDSSSKASLAGGPLDSHCFYGIFRPMAKKFQPLCSAVAKRAGKSEDYQNELNFMEGIYISLRLRIVLTPLRRYLKQLLCDVSSVAPAIRRCTMYFLSVCHLEFRTFRLFFEDTNFQVNFNALTEQLSHIFYDNLRPLIISCDSVDELREILDCFSLDILEPQSQSSYGSEMAPVFSMLFQLHMDMQERMIFKVESFITNEIYGFTPREDDLNYPERLWENRGQKHQISQLNFEEDIMADWYPPLKLLLHCLTKIHRVLDASTFQGLAQEAVNATLYSVSDAAKQLKSKQAQALDCEFFLIKNILILREQVLAFDCNLVRRSKVIDFTEVKARMKNLFTLSSFPRLGFASLALFDFFTPNLREQQVDSRQDLEAVLGRALWDLKHICDSLIGSPLKRASKILVKEAKHLSAFHELESSPPAALAEDEDVAVSQLSQAPHLHFEKAYFSVNSGKSHLQIPPRTADEAETSVSSKVIGDKERDQYHEKPDESRNLPVISAPETSSSKEKTISSKERLVEQTFNSTLKVTKLADSTIKASSAEVFELYEGFSKPALSMNEEDLNVAARLLAILAPRFGPVVTSEVSNLMELYSRCLKTNLPYIVRSIFVYFTDQETQFEAFKSNLLDYAANQLPLLPAGSQEEELRSYNSRSLLNSSPDPSKQLFLFLTGSIVSAAREFEATCLELCGKNDISAVTSRGQLVDEVLLLIKGVIRNMTVLDPGGRICSELVISTVLDSPNSTSQDEDLSAAEE